LKDRNKLVFSLKINLDNKVCGVRTEDREFSALEKSEGADISEIIHPDYLQQVKSLLKRDSSADLSILAGRFGGFYYYLDLTVSKENDFYKLDFYRCEDVCEPEIKCGSSDLKNLMKSLMGVHYRTDMFGNIIYLSAAIRSFLGFEPKYYIGNNLKKDHFLTPEKYEHVKNTILENKALENMDVALRHSSGKIIWIRANSIARYDKDGNYLGAEGFATDVTHLKNTESDLAHIKQILELKQKELDSVNVSMKYKVRSQLSKELKEEESLLYQGRLAEMGEMVSSIAHQWRQPLSALLFIIEDIRDAYHFGELDVTYLDDAVDECLSYVKFMSETMDDFRSFFRTDPGKENFNLIEKIIDVVKMQYGRFEVGAVNVHIVYRNDEDREDKSLLDVEYGKGIRTFTKEAEIDKNAVCFGFPNMFKQVILNLLNNSVDAIAEKRQAEGSEAYGKGLILIRVICAKNKFTIELKDNGTGFANADKSRIFDSDYTTKPVSKGTGIGLHMAKNIIEKSLGGKIRAENGENGALFVIDIPRVTVSAGD